MKPSDRDSPFVKVACQRSE